MSHRLRAPRRALLLTVPLVLASCTPTSPKPQAGAEAKSEPAPVEEPVVEEAKTEEKAPPAVEEPAVVEKPPPEPAKPLPPLPAQVEPIRPVPGVVTWNELPGVTTITDFRPFVFGLLADCGEVTCKLRDDNQVIEDPIDLPSGAIWGTWRSDAWIVTVEDEEGPEPEDPRDGMQIRVTTEYKRWRRNDFVLQEREVNDFGADSYYGPDGEGYFAGESFRKGWAGGMLLYERGSFRRLPADGPPAPTVAPPTDMCAFFEAESGAMFFVTVDNFESPKKFTLHPPCAAEGCKAAPLELPTGSSDAPWIWNFHLDVPRGGDAMSFLAHAAAASDEYEDDSQGFIIHYDVSADGVGSWVVEALRLEVDGEVSEIEGTSQLWPDTRGGIWVELDDELYYRSAKGKWFVVEVPGATAYANRLKPREFLALVEEGDATKVLATRDAPKAKPAAP